MLSLPIASRRISEERRRRRWLTALCRVVLPLRQSRRATGRQGQARHCTPTPIFSYLQETVLNVKDANGKQFRKLFELAVATERIT